MKLDDNQHRFASLLVLEFSMCSLCCSLYCSSISFAGDWPLRLTTTHQVGCVSWDLPSVCEFWFQVWVLMYFILFLFAWIRVIEFLMTLDCFVMIQIHSLCLMVWNHYACNFWPNFGIRGTLVIWSYIFCLKVIYCIIPLSLDLFIRRSLN